MNVLDHTRFTSHNNITETVWNGLTGLEEVFISYAPIAHLRVCVEQFCADLPFDVEYIYGFVGWGVCMQSR